MSRDEDRDEATKELFQDFYKNPLNDETIKRLRERLQKFHSKVVWEGKHVEALKELRGSDPMVMASETRTERFG